MKKERIISTDALQYETNLSSTLRKKRKKKEKKEKNGEKIKTFTATLMD